MLKPSGVSGMRQDEARFVRGWLRRPRLTGAVAPSSLALGRAMAAYVPAPETFSGQSRVVELGPGTGVLTACLIERGVPEKALVLVEYAAEFCALMRERFPAATVIQGDAYRPGAALDEALAGGRLEAVVSGLPLLTRSRVDRVRVITSSIARMEPGRPFIQFSYGLKAPVAAARLGLSLERSKWVGRNLPPARVFVYRDTAA